MIIQKLIPNWKPEYCNCDLEVGLRNAIHEVYPTCNLILCYFHLLGAWSRNAASYNVKNDLLFSKGCFNRFWMKLRGLPYLDLSQPLIRGAVIQSLRNEIQSYRKSSKRQLYLVKTLSTVSLL